MVQDVENGKEIGNGIVKGKEIGIDVRDLGIDLETGRDQETGIGEGTQMTEKVTEDFPGRGLGRWTRNRKPLLKGPW